MILYGLTGGIGAGKSTATAWLVAHGIPLIDTDEVARQVVAPGQPALEEIRAAFGPEVVSPDGTLDRGAVARIVFADPERRRQLEAITHPRIRAAWLQSAQSWRDQDQPLGVVVIPLLHETGAEDKFDSIVCVACKESTQRLRLQGRGWNAEQIEHRLRSQWPLSRKMERANFVVWNESPLEILHAQLARIFPTAG